MVPDQGPDRSPFWHCSFTPHPPIRLRSPRHCISGKPPSSTLVFQKISIKHPCLKHQASKLFISANVFIMKASIGFRQSAEKSLVLSLKLASAGISAHASGSEKRYRTRTVGRFSIPETGLALPHRRMHALGRAGRSRSRHFTAKRLPKTREGY